MMVLPVTTKEASGRQFRFEGPDWPKHPAHPVPTKFKNFLARAGGNANTAGSGTRGTKNDPLAATLGRKEAMRASTRLNELFVGHGKNGNLPTLKGTAQHKEMIKTSYMPFLSNMVAEAAMRGEEAQQNVENGIGGFRPGKIKRPKSGENTAATLKKIYVGPKDKGRRLVWGTPGMNQ